MGLGTLSGIAGVTRRIRAGRNSRVAHGPRNLRLQIHQIFGVQAKDLEMRQMLESLLDDLNKLVFIPEWPVAEVLLSAACDRLDWIVAGKKADKGTVSAQYKALAIELLGSVIQLVANHSRLAALPLAVDLDENAGDGEEGACRRARPRPTPGAIAS